MTKKDKIARLKEVISAIDPKIFDDLCLVANQVDKKSVRKEKLERLGWYENK